MLVYKLLTAQTSRVPPGTPAHNMSRGLYSVKRAQRESGTTGSKADRSMLVALPPINNKTHI